MDEMRERQKANLAQLPREFCDGTMMMATRDHLVLLLSSGAKGSAFALSPEHAKAFAQQIAYQIAEFEKNVRKINMEWTPNIPSPISKSDLDVGNK